MSKYIIRTSDRRNFKTCRRKWGWSSPMRGNLRPAVTPKPLEFGTAWHAGMGTYYDPATWHLLKNPAQAQFVYAGTIQTFRDTIAAQRRYYEQDRELFVEMEEDFKEREALGVEMLENYFSWARTNDTFTPIKIEVEFEIPVIDPRTQTGEPLFVQGHDGTPWPVMYQGRLDGIVQDFQGWYWILEHKAQPLDSLVATPNGWKIMGKLCVGDRVIGSNGSPTQVIGIYPQGTLPIYKVTFKDGSSVKTSGDHLWTVYRATGRPGSRVLTTLQLAEQIKKPSNQGFRYLPIMEPMDLPERELPVDPYVMGALLGDGSFRDSTIKLSNQNASLVNRVRSYHRLSHISRGDYNVLGLSPIIQGLGLKGLYSYEKFIPEIYKHSSIEQRMELVRGMLDTDGTCRNGIASLLTTSERLARDFREVLESLGGTGRTLQEPSYLEGKKYRDHYRVHVRLPEKLGNPFWIEEKASKWHASNVVRSIHSVEYIGEEEAQCISIDSPDGLYATEHYLLTHNTTARWDDMRHLDLDEQLTSYCWALRQLGINVRGAIYSEAYKAKPEPVSVNQQQRKGRWLSVNKQQTVTYESYLEAIHQHNEDPDLYAEMLEFLKVRPNPFFRRFAQHRSSTELDEIQTRIGWEALDMVRADLPLYPTPGKFNCSYCSFKEPCLAYNQGGDYQFLLNELFVDNKEVLLPTIPEAELEADTNESSTL